MIKAIGLKRQTGSITRCRRIRMLARCCSNLWPWWGTGPARLAGRQYQLQKRRRQGAAEMQGDWVPSNQLSVRIGEARPQKIAGSIAVTKVILKPAMHTDRLNSTQSHLHVLYSDSKLLKHLRESHICTPYVAPMLCIEIHIRIRCILWYGCVFRYNGVVKSMTSLEYKRQLNRRKYLPKCG